LEVDGAEVEEQSFACLERRSVEGASIPAGAVETRVRDAAGRSLRRERNADRSGPCHLAGAGPARLRIEGELPLPVERCPAGTPELWPRVRTNVEGHADLTRRWRRACIWRSRRVPADERTLKPSSAAVRTDTNTGPGCCNRS